MLQSETDSQWCSPHTNALHLMRASLEGEARDHLSTAIVIISSGLGTVGIGNALFIVIHKLWPKTVTISKELQIGIELVVFVNINFLYVTITLLVIRYNSNVSEKSYQAVS